MTRPEQTGLKPYNPELGQLMYDSPVGEFELGDMETWVVDNLRDIAKHTKVNDLGGNVGGHGVNFQNDVFEMRNYHWCNDGGDCEIAAQPNFKSGSVEFRWYKYLGRGMSVNRQVTEEVLTEIFQRCKDSLSPIT